MALEQEFNYYLENQDELVKKYDGKTLVIVGNEVVGAYNNYDEAYMDACKNYELGKFLMQRCSEGVKDYTMTFHTQRVLF